ncbi:MAG: dihydrolipoamide succinyltransferase [Bacteroidetes bacterium]|nr:MAG: dihydrolipoamide succinyltransferase [Bacteroidota bacterium]
MIDIVMPPSEEAVEAVVLTWYKQPGEAVEAHEPLLELSTDKVTMEVPAPASGILREILKHENDPVRPGEVLGRLDPDGAGEAPAEAAPGVPAEAAPVDAAPTTADADTPDRRTRLSPLVKRMLKEHNLDPAQIPGTGRGGRITHRDVKAYLERQAAEKAAPAPAPAPAGPIPSRRVPHSHMRRRIADHMVESMLRTAPHVTAVFEADLSAIVHHRKRHKDAFAARGVRLTYTAYFVRAAVEALQEVPEVNSRWHDDALEIFEDMNIGVATALGREGLIVPVIHRAQLLGLFGIAARLQELTEKARAGKLLPDDVQRGTFTLTNHGVSGSLIATPIIHQPQSAILGIGKMEKRIKVREEHGRDVIDIAPRAYVTLTIDHRALDGYTANLFLSKFVEVLERWPEEKV